MTSVSRHITWDSFRAQVLEPGLPAKLAVGGTPSVWLSFRGRTLSLSTPIKIGTTVPRSPLRQLKVSSCRQASESLLEVSTDREDLFREFFFLALGIADLIQKRGSDAVSAFNEALDTWKELLQASARMSEQQQLGLFGELLLLERLVRRSGATALDAWVGPRGEPHDFRLGRHEIEVKSTRSSKRIHAISSLAQLVPSIGSRLYLLSLQLEPAGSAEGRSLPALIASIRMLLKTSGSALAVFNILLKDQLHYRDDDAHLYEDERLRPRTPAYLVAVDASCPRLTAESVAAAVGASASRIKDVTYWIDVDGLGFEESTKEFRKVIP